MVITSVNDGTHGKKSLHAIGHAVDIRVHGLDEQLEESLEDFGLTIWDCLGGPVGQYDVVMEHLGTPNAHLHIEYQPHSAAR